MGMGLTGRTSPREIAGALLPSVRRKRRAAAAKQQAEQAFHDRFRAQLAGREVFRHGGRLTIADARPGSTPLQARAEALDLVCAALTAAAIPYFTLRTRSAVESAVAVPEADRARALDVLEQACTSAALYAGPEPAVKETPPALGAEAWEALAGASCVRVFRYYRPSADLLLGPAYGCVVEFWREEGGRLYAPRPNRVAESVPVEGERADAPEAVFSQFAPRADTPVRRTRAEFLGTLMDEIDFPVDAVYTWVDGGDPVWEEQRAAAMAAISPGSLHEQAANDSRYIDRDELRYSLRSLALHAPWIRRVWLVTAGQVPTWLDTSHPKVTVVDHKEIFPDGAALPTFNSHAIETRLHHIDGLSEHFLYFNDDFLLGRPVTPGTFFHANGMTKFFMSVASQIPSGAPTAADPPISAAGKNSRRLIEELAGRRLTQKLQHIPYPLRRSVLAALEDRYAAEFAATAGHRFRDPADLSVPANLYHYYSFVNGMAVPGAVAYTYADVADTGTPEVLERLIRRRDQDVICLNDTGSDAADHDRQNALAAGFLSRYYPAPGPFELPR